jgi:hypothetical protein
MEKVFMSAVDGTAASALEYMLKRKEDGDIPDPIKAAWARFIYSLILRTPEHLIWAQAKLKEMQPEMVDAERDRYLLMRTEADPQTFEEFREQFLNDPRQVDPNRHLHRFISNGFAAQHIMSMRWSTAYFPNTRFSLLTSDRPLVMTNGFAGTDGHFAIPISPRHLFLGANSEQIETRIKAMPPDEIVKTMNIRVVEQARKFVYGENDKPLRFVRNHFGKKLQSTPLG